MHHLNQEFDPLKFEYVYNTDQGRYLYHCRATQIGLDGHRFRCSKMYRKGSIKYPHEHSFSIHVTTPTQKKLPTEQEPEIQPIIKELALMTAALHLTIRQATSNSMIDFINTVYLNGFIDAQDHPEQSLNSVPRQSCSAYRLRDAMINLAEEKKQNQFAKIREVHFVSAAIDNGTLGRRHFLFVSLLNPGAGLSPVFFETQTTPHWKASEFAEFGSQLNAKITSLGATLVSIVGDNYRPQVSGLGEWKPKSFQQQLTNAEDGPILYVKCNCHILNLSILDAIKENEQIAEAVDQLNVLVVLLRKNDVIAFVGSSPPTIPQTRWAYIYETATITLNRILKLRVYLQRENLPSNIRQFLNQHPWIPQIVDDHFDAITALQKTLEPIKRLMMLLEKNTTALSKVYPLVMKTAKELRKTACYSNCMFVKSFGKSFCDAMLHRFKSTARWDLILTSFAFSDSGRHHLRWIAHQQTPSLTQQFECNKDTDCDLSTFIKPIEELELRDLLPSNGEIE
jgi:hypothetical protein